MGNAPHSGGMVRISREATPPHRARRWGVAETSLAALAFAAAGGLCALALQLVSHNFVLTVLVYGIPLLVGATLLALFRFEWFVVALLVTRASFDALHLAQGGALKGPGLDPASALGVIFIMSATLWLYVQWQAGQWVRLSLATQALAVFVGACLLSCPLSGHRLDSLLLTAKVLAGVLMFAVIEQLLGQDPRRARIILGGAFASFAVPAFLGLRQWLGGVAATRVTPNAYGSDVLEGGSRVRGTFVHPNPFATYLVLVLLAALALFVLTRHRPRVFYAVVTAVAGTLLLATYTRVAWAAALVGAAYLGWRHSRAILIAVAIVVVGAALAVPSVGSRLADLGGSSGPEIPGVPSSSLSWRLGYWGDLLPLTLKNPVTGIGLGTSQYEAAAAKQRSVAQSGTVTALLPHSVFVQVIVETGAVGLAALIFVIAAFAKTLRERVALARPGWERTLALAAVALSLSVLVQMPTENLLGETVIYWYLAAFGTFGLGHVRTRQIVPA